MIWQRNLPFSTDPQLVWRASVGSGPARLAADLWVRVLVSELCQLTESFAILDLCSAVVGQLGQPGNRRAENRRDKREHHRLLKGHHGGRRERRKVKSDKPSKRGLAKRVNTRESRSTSRLYTLDTPESHQRPTMEQCRRRLGFHLWAAYEFIANMS